ncbi:MAG: hypothetical protein AAB285_00540, partial [candidate division NC10 bacterium]
MMTMRPLATILVASVLVSGCGGVTLKELLGYPADPTPTQPGRSAALPWALIKNPAYFIFDNYLDQGSPNDWIKKLASDYSLLSYGYRLSVNQK